MNKDTTKKIVGAVGAAIASAALWLSQPDNVRNLQSLFPNNPHAVSLIGTAGLIAAWWGTHPLTK
jgi:hypothetical protein